jgi:hypothetical protein
MVTCCRASENAISALSRAGMTTRLPIKERTFPAAISCLGPGFAVTVDHKVGKCDTGCRVKQVDAGLAATDLVIARGYCEDCRKAHCRNLGFGVFEEDGQIDHFICYSLRAGYRRRNRCRAS